MEQYNVYKNGSKVAITESKEYLFEGLQPDTSYKLGVSRVVDGKESEIVEITVKTEELPTELLDRTTNLYDFNGMTVNDIKNELDTLGIEYTSSDRKQDLFDKLPR